MAKKTPKAKPSVKKVDSKVSASKKAKAIDVDAMVNAKKTTGTDFQAYMRDIIRNAGK